MSNILLLLGVLVFVAHLLTQVFRRTLIPDVLVLVLIGLIAGPVAGWISPDDFGKAGQVISTIALVVILFEGGTSLNIPTLRSALGATGKLALGCFVLTALIATLVGHTFLGLSWIAAAILGATIGGTSSAVVIPMVGMLNLNEKPATVLVLESAITDVLCIVGVFALIHVVVDGSVNPGQLVGSVLAAMLFATVIGILGGIGWLLVLRRLRDFPNTISSTLAYVFIVYGVTEGLGFSGGIAALALGITMTNYQEMGLAKLKILDGQRLTPLTEVDFLFYKESVFLLKTFFFVYLGVSIRFSETHIFLVVVGMLAAIFLVRILLTRFIVDQDYSPHDAAITSMMAPKGLAAAVLATLPMQYGIEGSEIIRDTTYTVVLGSITLCALLVMVYPIPFVQSAYAALLPKTANKTHE